MESFRDSAALRSISYPGSLARQLLLNPCIVDPEDKTQFEISSILLIGNMYCPSNDKLRASKFYELCQTDLNPHISAHDRDLKRIFKKMIEISYVMMVNLYTQNKKEDIPGVE